MKSMKSMKFVWFVGMVLVIGCSSVVRIDSVPSGASVMLNGKVVGTSPVVVRVDDNAFARHGVVITKDGYRVLATNLMRGGVRQVAYLFHFLIFPLIWSEGHVSNQVFKLEVTEAEWQRRRVERDRQHREARESNRVAVNLERMRRASRGRSIYMAALYDFPHNGEVVLSGKAHNYTTRALRDIRIIIRVVSYEGGGRHDVELVEFVRPHLKAGGVWRFRKVLDNPCGDRDVMEYEVWDMFYRYGER